jgi:hypothetical protein
MTDQSTSELAWAPDACTLPTARRPLRRAEFDALFAAARGAERISAVRLRVTLDGDAAFADSVRDLAARETECCSFFTFAVSRPAPDLVVLDIEVPDAHVGVLDALAAVAVRGGR